jgi:RNA-directed DNA polymerase
VPEITSIADLAAFLDLHTREQEWLADRRSWEQSAAQRLRNYRYRWVGRESGLPRLIERPKGMLKAAQRRVLHEIIDVIPPHDSAHGFRRGHSPITHARRHTGQRVVLRFDLEDFFASVGGGRTYSIFRVAGYPESVAHTLTALCTNVVPRAEWAAAPRSPDPRLRDAHRRLGGRLAIPHLPQGAPTSPALANLACYRLDVRLSELAERCGGIYSRYADDITISGGTWLLSHAADIRHTVELAARDEGLRLNPNKSQLMTRGGRQQTCGIVVNTHVNIPRREYDQVKAQLHDATLNGFAAANRTGLPAFEAHLRGRISWIESLNPARGAALRRRLDTALETQRTQS